MESSKTVPHQSKTLISQELLHDYLYGYKRIRLVTSEEVIIALQKEQQRKVNNNLPETPPLSPRKIRTPDDISLCTSSIPGNAFGACAVKRIPHGTWFGPFEGKLVRLTETQGVNTEHMWEIFHDGEVSHFLDGQGENSWMSFVCCARHKMEQNLVIFQYHGCIYYRTIKDVLPGKELLVWYDSKYTQLLGLPIAWNDNRSTGGKRKSHDDPSRKRREKISPIPLLQKIDTKIPSPNTKKIVDFDVFKRRHELMSPSFDLFPSVRCEKCFFSFYTKEQLSKHKCLNTIWTPGMRLPSIEKPRDYYHHPINLKMPETNQSYLQAYYQNYHYPSPPMDSVAKHLPPTIQPKGNAPSLKNFRSNVH